MGLSSFFLGFVGFLYLLAPSLNVVLPFPPHIRPSEAMVVSFIPNLFRCCENTARGKFELVVLI